MVDLERGIQKVRTVRRMPEEFRWNAEMLQNIRFTPWKPTPGKSAQVVGRNMYITERMIDAHGTTDNCRKCSTGQENPFQQNVDRGLKRYSMICCRRNSDKLQSFRRTVVIQTVVTPAPAASSSSPSAEERIRQTRAGLHRPEQESVTASASDQVVEMGDAVSPAPASSSGKSGPGEAPAQERLKHVDTDEEMRTGESDAKKPRERSQCVN